MSEKNNAETGNEAMILLFCFLGVVLFFVVGYFFKPNVPEPIKSNTDVVQTNPETGIEIVEHDWCRCGYRERCICGSVLNDTDKDARFVFVEINLYDESGVQVDSISPSISNLEAHGKWEFKRHVYDDNVSNYKIKKKVRFH